MADLVLGHSGQNVEREAVRERQVDGDELDVRFHPAADEVNLAGQTSSSPIPASTGVTHKAL